MPPDTLRCWTPPRLAAYLAVSADKVLAWIRSGRLRAINIAAGTLGRPRYRIEPAAVAEFLGQRQATPPAKAKRQRQPKRPAGWTDYYPEATAGGAT